MYSNIPASASEWFTFVASHDVASLPLNLAERRTELIVRYLHSKGLEDRVRFYRPTSSDSLANTEQHEGNQP
jgi:hypothetical protein